MVQRSLRWFFLFGAAVVPFFLSASVIAQDLQESQPRKLITAKEGSTDGQRKEIEPGVFLYGQPHRFAEVGHCQSFDSSPDGRTLVFAAGKLKFFDLIDNKVVEEIGEPNEYYQQVAYSPDGRFVFGYFNSGRAPVVRMYDAIDGSPMSKISTAVEDDGPNNQFYAQTMAISADAKYIGIQAYNAIQIRKVDSGKLVLHLKDLSYVQRFTFSPDGQELLIGLSDCRMELWDLTAMKR